MMKKATFGQRVAATLIDLLIIGIVVAIFIVIFRNAMVKPMPDSLYNLAQDYFNGAITPDEYMNKMQELMKEADVLAFYNGIQNFCIATFASFIVVFCIYYILIPMLWKNGQTVGRFVMKIRVKNADDNDYTFGTCLLRELVGNLLISVVLNCCCFIPLIANLIIIGKDGLSIADGISRSDLVSTIHYEDEEQNANPFNDYLNANITKETNVDDQDFFFNEDEKKDDNSNK